VEHRSEACHLSPRLWCVLLRSFCGAGREWHVTLTFI
jgi:hypothetical protein